MGTVLSDDLTAKLAAEEHAQGRPYTADPQHCERCAEVDRAWAVATCEHADYVDITQMCDPMLQRLCNSCGTITEVPR